MYTSSIAKVLSVYNLELLENCDVIDFIDNPSEAVQLEAVKKSGYAIYSIKNPSEKVQLEAVKQNGIAIQHIKNQSEAVQLEAVKENGLAINYIKNPNKAIQLEAVKQNGFAIKYINNPSEKLQLEAVKEDGNAIRYIKDPTDKVKQYVKDHTTTSELVTADFKTVKKKFTTDQNIEVDVVDTYLEEFKELRDKNKIKKVDEKSIDFWGKKSWEEFKGFVDKTKKEKTATETKKLNKIAGAELVAENDGWYVYHITTHEACKIYGSGTKWCITEPDRVHWKQYSSEYNIYFLLSKNLSKEESEFYKIAVTVDVRGDVEFWDSLDNNYRFISASLKIPKVKFKNFDLSSQPEEVQLEAVKYDGNAIKYIENPSEAVQLEAIKENGYAIKYIENPSEAVQLEAVKRNGYAIQHI